MAFNYYIFLEDELKRVRVGCFPLFFAPEDGGKGIMILNFRINLLYVLKIMIHILNLSKILKYSKFTPQAINIVFNQILLLI